MDNQKKKQILSWNHWKYFYINIMLKEKIKWCYYISGINKMDY